MGYTNEPWSQYRPSDARCVVAHCLNHSPPVRRVVEFTLVHACVEPLVATMGSAATNLPRRDDRHVLLQKTAVAVAFVKKGGGYTSQIYAIRQALAKALVAWYQKFVDEASKKEIKEILQTYDRSLLVADPRRCEPKKFGGRGARAR